MILKKHIAIILFCLSISIAHSQTYISASFLSTNSSNTIVNIQCGEIFNPNIENIKFGTLPLFIKSNNTAIEKTSHPFKFTNPSYNGYLEGYSKGLIDIHIYNIQGKLVTTQKVNGRYKLDVQNIPSGIYTLKFTENNKSKHYKWIK